MITRYEITGETHERAPRGEWMKSREVIDVMNAIQRCHWAADAIRIATQAIEQAEGRP